LPPRVTPTLVTPLSITSAILTTVHCVHIQRGKIWEAVPTTTANVYYKHPFYVVLSTSQSGNPSKTVHTLPRQFSKLVA